MRRRNRLVKGKKRRKRRGEWIPRSGYTTDKPISLSKVPKGPGPGAELPKNNKTE